MELSFNELKKRDVINVIDGRCFGKITDLTLSFPTGILTGITVPGKKSKCFFKLFDKGKMFISEKDIIKIGGDAILVKIKCGDTCAESVSVGKIPPSACSPCQNGGETDGFDSY